VHVFLSCGLGQTGNVNFEVNASTISNTVWHDTNFSTAAHRNVNGPFIVCPANSNGCLEYAYHGVTSPWYVDSADPTTSTGFPFGASGYCSPHI
jgi:hypothetical protein